MPLAHHADDFFLELLGNPLDGKVRALEAKVARLEKELHTAHTILDVQGKVAGLLGFSLKDGKDC